MVVKHFTTKRTLSKSWIKVSCC